MSHSQRRTFRDSPNHVLQLHVRFGRMPTGAGPGRFRLTVTEKRIRTSAASFGNWRVAMVTLILIWGSGLACSPGGLWDPEALFRNQYQGWGNQLQQHRSDDFVWKDGSGWTDGVSDIPPGLPLPPGGMMGDSLTCAQEEVLAMMAFPEDEEPEEWYLERDAEETNRRWKVAFADLVWGDHTDNLIWLAREPFAERCGLASHFRLFNFRL